MWSGIHPGKLPARLSAFGQLKSPRGIHPALVRWVVASLLGSVPNGSSSARAGSQCMPHDLGVEALGNRRTICRHCQIASCAFAVMYLVRRTPIPSSFISSTHLLFRLTILSPPLTLIANSSTSAAGSSNSIAATTVYPLVNIWLVCHILSIFAKVSGNHVGALQLDLSSGCPQPPATLRILSTARKIIKPTNFNKNRNGRIAGSTSHLSEDGKGCVLDSVLAPSTPGDPADVGSADS